MRAAVLEAPGQTPTVSNFDEPGGRIHVVTERYPLDEAPRAWQAQADGPHTKIAIEIS